MKIPDWVLKFASRKLAAYLAGLLANHIAVGAPKTEIEAAVLLIVDGLMTLGYLWAQGKVDHIAANSAALTPDEVADKAVNAITEAAKKARAK